MDFDSPIKNPQIYSSQILQSPEKQLGNSQWSKKNSDIRQKADRNKMEGSRKDQMYFDLQEMFKSCKGDLNKFFQQIQGPISEYYMFLSRKTLTQMNHDEITDEQFKIIISEGILQLNLNILKIIGQDNDFNYDKKTFKKLNDFQHSLVGYIKVKYPRGQNALQSDELKNIFKQFDRVNDLEFDILKNSNFYFDESEDDKIIKNIKMFINKIIIQCQKYYPYFQKMMQDKIFWTTNQKGEKGEKGEKEKEKEKVSLNYKIGRKISQNVAKYTKFDTGVLEIFSPQILRVLIKWMEDLEGIIRQTSEKITKKQSFKRYIGEKQVENQKYGNKQIIFDDINRDEYSQVVNKLIQRIQGIRSGLDKKNQFLFGQMGKFNDRLLKALYSGKPVQKYIPIEEIEIIKYSCFNSKFVEYILTEKLVFSIKELIKVGQSFGKMMKLDLINFKVLDLMRCMFSGNKKEILQVHQNFKKLEKTGEIDIIKIKNRLSSHLNDVMIIFKMKDSWIICETQLILSGVGDKIHKNRKNTEVINHFFYELERSPYGILSQIAVLLTYKDTKISYQNKITFEQSKVDIDQCREGHNVKVEVKQEHSIPFICSKCSFFYGKLQNMFKIYRCSKCKISICSKCILKQNPHLGKSFITRSIERSLQKKIDNMGKQMKGKSSGSYFQKQQENKTSKRITTDTLFKLFHPNRLTLAEKFGGDKKKVIGSELMKYLNSFYDQNDQKDWSYSKNINEKKSEDCYLMIINFLRGEAYFKFYYYNHRKKQIENTFDSKEKYDQYSFYSYCDHEMLLILPLYHQLHAQQNINNKHLFISVPRSQLQKEISKIKNTKNENQYKVISVQLQNNKFLVLDYRAKGEREKDKIEFKQHSLKKFAQKIPAIQREHSKIQFDNIGIETKHLQFFESLQWKTNIKILRITQNKIIDIRVILQNCLNLQKLYFSENCVEILCFTTQLKNLKTLHGSQNKISKIKGLHQAKNLEKLFLSNNQLKEFITCNMLTHLKVLNLEQNKLVNISSILQSSFPQLEQLLLSNQLENKQNTSKIGIYQNSINFRKLKLFQCSNNSHLFPEKQILISSQNLESITLNNCSLQNITFSSDKCIESLNYLRLKENNLSSFKFLHPEEENQKSMFDTQSIIYQKTSNEIYQNDSLIELDLSKNQLDYLPVLRFSSLKKMKLAKNYISNIKSLSYSKLPQLQFLDLSQNMFIEICPLPLGKLKQLQLNKIEKANCIHNLFSTTSQLGSIEKITISECKITDFSFNVKMPNNKLIRLNELYFRQVQFTSITEEQKVFFEIKSLRIMEWKNCSIKSFPIMKLQGLKQLRIFQDKYSIGTLKNLQKCEFPKLQTLKINQTKTKDNDNQVSTIYAPKLKFLQIQGLKIVNLDQFLKNTFANLQQVRIQYSQVETFCNQSIAKLKSIRKLSLRSNKLRKFICCEPLDKLTYLDLSQNKLKSFPLIKAKKLTQLKLWGNKFEDISELEKCDLPLIQSIRLFHCQLENSVFPRLNLPRLQNLSLTNCMLNDVSKLEKSILPQLKLLDLSRNKIKQFPKITFPKLASLSLLKNNLQPLSFQNILQLKTITDLKIGYQWNQNQIILSLPQSSYLKHLKKLSFVEIPLQKLPQLDIPQLQYLRVSKCQLTDVSEFAKGQYKFLEQIYLSYNKLTNIPKVFMEQLRIAKFSYNQIFDVEEFLESSLPSLQQLNFTGNKLKNLNKIPFRSIKQLYLSNNQLTQLNCFNLNEYPQLKSLKAQKTQISKIEKFPRMPKLKRIYFSSSKLQNLNWLIGSVGNLPELYHLSLSNNLITQLPDILNKYPNLNKLQIQGNPLQNVDGLISFEGLKNLWQPKINLNLNDKQFHRIQNKLIQRNPKIIVEKFSPQQVNQQQSNNPTMKSKFRPFAYSYQDLDIDFGYDQEF